MFIPAYLYKYMIRLPLTTRAHLNTIYVSNKSSWANECVKHKYLVRETGETPNILEFKADPCSREIITPFDAPHSQWRGNPPAKTYQLD